MAVVELTKALDKINHHALFSKLMKRRIGYRQNSLHILNLVQHVELALWKSAMSHFFQNNFVARQLGLRTEVLSPQLFAVYTNDTVNHLPIKADTHYPMQCTDG